MHATALYPGRLVGSGEIQKVKRLLPVLTQSLHPRFDDNHTLLGHTSFLPIQKKPCCRSLPILLTHYASWKGVHAIKRQGKEEEIMEPERTHVTHLERRAFHTPIHEKRNPLLPFSLTMHSSDFQTFKKEGDDPISHTHRWVKG